MQRNRNPANGYRSNPIGIGGGASAGGVPAGGPVYRNYNRGGFGRGQPPPPRRTDVFLEAGKLAADYLIAKGLLPPSSLNGKWQSNNMKNQIGGGADGVSDAVSGIAAGRRRFPDEIRARRTMGSFKHPGVELNRESNRSENRSSSLSDKVKSLSDKQGDGESFSGSIEEQRSGKDGANEDKKSASGDLESKSHEGGTVDTSIQNQQNQSPDDNVSVKTPNSDVSHQSLVDSAEKNTITITDDVAMDDANQESEKPIIKEESKPEENENNNNTVNNNSSDLLTFIRFNKVPTRTRSSVTLKSSKSEPALTSVDENKTTSQSFGEPRNTLQADENQELKSNNELKIEAVSSEEEDQKYKFVQGVCTRSQSFPQRSSISEQGLGGGEHSFTRSSSEVLGRGEKRPIQIQDNDEEAKKPRNWASENTQSNNYMQLSNSQGEQSSSQSEQCNVYAAEEKQLFPNSFKICDLNLMGASEVSENHDNTKSSVIGFSSIGQTKQEPVSVDFDLTMNSSCDIPDRHTMRDSDGKGVEVIDLDCDSGQEDKDFINSERRDEAIFTDLESFPDSMQRVSDMPQDGYGLMISELLEADMSNSTGHTGVNSMHNEISLQNEEGMLGDDESIYMSLGEIPISFVPVWDQQPSQGYDKRY